MSQQWFAFEKNGLVSQRSTASLSRREDQSTSHQAAENIKPKLAGIKQFIYTVANDSFADRDFTANEIAKACHDQNVQSSRHTLETYRKRVPEMISVFVKTQERICSFTGNKAQAFKLLDSNEFQNTKGGVDV